MPAPALTRAACMSSCLRALPLLVVWRAHLSYFAVCLSFTGDHPPRLSFAIHNQMNTRWQLHVHSSTATGSAALLLVLVVVLCCCGSCGGRRGSSGERRPLLGGDEEVSLSFVRDTDTRIHVSCTYPRTCKTLALCVHIAASLHSSRRMHAPYHSLSRTRMMH